jgi:hypothetical protein
MRYGQELEIAAVPGDDEYDMFLKHAKMIMIKYKEVQGHASAEIHYTTRQSKRVIKERRFKYIPAWFSFTTSTITYRITILTALWEA